MHKLTSLKSQDFVVEVS